MKRALALLLSASLTLSLAACGGGGGGTSQSGSSGTTSSDGAGELTATQQIIQEAQGMTLEELAQHPGGPGHDSGGAGPKGH